MGRCSRLKNSMAGIKFSKKEVEKHLGKITEELKEKISMFGTHFEGMDDESIELEILPNRPDLFSLQGFAKSFSAFLGKDKEKGLREYKVSKPEKNFEVKIDSSVKDIRPYTACAIAKDMKFDDEKIKEIIDIQEKIHATLGRNRKKIAIGIYPLEKITLPIKLEARKPQDIRFIPLEFDREINGLQILQQHPAGREYAHLLEGKDKFPVFVDASGEILSMPPIINSHKTGKITEATKDIFIECSGFDFEILKKTINILTTMLADMGGKVCQMELAYGNKKEITPDLTPEKMKLNMDNVNKLLGLELKEGDIKKLLERMGYNYNGKDNLAEVPAWRTDIMHEVDLIEDIAIAYGYDKFKPEIPQISTAGEVSKIETLKRNISEILSGMNMLELSNYHLLTKDEAKLFGITNAVEVKDSKSDYSLLRPNLAISVLKTIKNNVDSEYPQRVFEIGEVFEKNPKEETGISEPNKLCVSIASPNAGFTEIKQTLDYVMRMLGKGKEYSIEQASAEASYFIEGRSGKIIVNKKEIGMLGEVRLQLLDNLGIKMPVAAFEISLEIL